MPIEIACPECEKVYKVKDDAAGKKFRCKECQTVIPIPADAQPAEPDSWDVAGDDDPELPPVVRKRKPVPVKRSREVVRESYGGGMPVTVIISIVLNGLMLALNILGMIGGLLIGNYANTGFGFIRLLVDAVIIKGLLEASNRIRWNSIILDGAGVAALLFCVSPAMIFAPQEFHKAMGQDAVGRGALMTVFVAALVAQGVIWLADMILLLTPSARDYCNQ